MVPTGQDLHPVAGWSEGDPGRGDLFFFFGRGDLRSLGVVGAGSMLLEGELTNGSIRKHILVELPC